MKKKPPKKSKQRLKKPNRYRSGYELKIATHLENHRIAYDYEPTIIKYRLPVTGACCAKCGSVSVVVVRRYNPDFLISPNGKLNPKGQFYLEAKGKFTSKDRTKMVSVINSNPTLKFRMIFMRDNKINKNSKIRYSDWCRDRGIEYAVGTALPEEWLK